MTPRSLVAIATAAAAVLLIGGCADNAEDDPPSSSSQSPTDATPSASTEQVDIGGRSLYVKCWGKRVAGEPSIILVSGQGPPAGYWGPMAEAFATEGNHLCAYDRAGVGGSAKAPETRRTTKDQVTELVALLDAVELDEPVVVVAHSLGSLPATALVDRAPDRVAGVVLVDPVSPRMSAVLRAALPPEKPGESPALADERRFLFDFLADPAQNPESLLLAASEAEVAKLLDKPGPLFGDRPVVVLQAPAPAQAPGIPSGYHATTVAATRDGNQEFAAESTRGTVIEVKDSGHDIHVDQPEVVIRAIRDVLAAAR